MKIILILLATAIISTIIFFSQNSALGGKAKGKTLEKMRQSPNYKDGKFRNLEETKVMVEGISKWKVMKEFFFGAKNGIPKEAIITKRFCKETFVNSNNKIIFTWFGHSTVLLNIDGIIVLTDPVFSKHASPVPFTNKAFEYTNTYSVDNLPDPDIVIISHDHYDHLDYKTIKKLNRRTGKFYVPLGVDAHLLKWNIDKAKIVVADWWDSYEDMNGIKITATPARHFSGRGLSDRNSTLWASWVIEAKDSKIYFGGDSGYGKHFKKIGNKFGPFDITFLECGQYHENWKYIHAMPEESVQANIDLNGTKMLPVHWAKFKLSLHSWTDPIERSSKEAARLGVELLQPVIGEIVVLKDETNGVVEDLVLNAKN